MRTKVLKSGNSLAIQIPPPVAQEFGLNPSSEVDVSLVRGTLVVHPLPGETNWALDDLLSKVTEENLHQEVDTDPAVGREAW